MSSGTPINEPYLVYGYTGHVPGYKFRVGVSYGKATNQLFLDPCAGIRPSQRTSVVGAFNYSKKTALKPHKDKLKLVQDRVAQHGTTYAYPVSAGYGGHVPKIIGNCGECAAVAAVNGVSEFERYMQLRRCELDYLQRQDTLISGRGHFRRSVNERLGPNTHFRAPLTLILPFAKENEHVNCKNLQKFEEKKEPYTRETLPLFMDCDNPEKYITANYAGHVPYKYRHFGKSNKKVTNNALCEYITNRHRRDVSKWCPMSGLKNFPLPLAAPSSCPESEYPIYLVNGNMVVSYGGHVPGQKFVVGKSFGSTTVNAKKWLTDARQMDLFEDLVFR